MALRQWGPPLFEHDWAQVLLQPPIFVAAYVLLARRFCAAEAAELGNWLRGLAARLRRRAGAASVEAAADSGRGGASGAV